jgi:hypothetical protein
MFWNLAAAAFICKVAVHPMSGTDFARIGDFIDTDINR